MRLPEEQESGESNHDGKKKGDLIAHSQMFTQLPCHHPRLDISAGRDLWETMFPWCSPESVTPLSTLCAARYACRASDRYIGQLSAHR